MNPLRFLMIAPTPFFADRGCHVRIYEEAHALKKRGHAVAISTYHIGNEIDNILTYRILDVPWYRKLSAGPSIHKFYLDVLLILRTISAVKMFKPDIIYAHLHEGAFLGKLIANIFNLPLIFDYQGSLTEEIVDHNFITQSGLSYKIFKSIEKNIDKSADLIFTSSTVSAKKLRDSSISVPVFILDDGVDSDLFQPIENPDIDLELPGDGLTIVYLGLLNKYQGIDVLLEAIKILAEQRDDLHFLVMGYPNVEYYQQLAKEKHIDSLITFTGRIPYLESVKYLCLGDIAISPKISRTEANGKLLNYMACGLPTIAFDSLINRQILGEYGIYAEWNDPKSLADSIMDLADNPDQRNYLSHHLRERAVEKFSWNTRAKRIENKASELTKNRFLT
jgi:glycosyltransferase involved in cell wall biosynthesis